MLYISEAHDEKGAKLRNPKKFYVVSRQLTFAAQWTNAKELKEK